MRIALVQCTSGSDKAANLSMVGDRAEEAASNGADLVVFPEATMQAFNSGRLDKQAEPSEGGEAHFAKSVRELAERLGVVIVLGMFSPAGSVEVDGKTINRVANTALITGRGLHEKYEKMHCYDAFGFRESDTVRAGSELVTVDVPTSKEAAAKDRIRVGLAICYDVRFPEHFVELARSGASLIVLPTSWSDGPGKLEQWRTLTAARALDATVYLAAAGQARPGGEAKAGTDDGPTGIGHSVVVDPTGRRIAEGGYDEEILYAEISPGTVTKVQESIPVLAWREEHEAPTGKHGKR